MKYKSIFSFFCQLASVDNMQDAKLFTTFAH